MPKKKKTCIYRTNLVTMGIGQGQIETLPYLFNETEYNSQGGIISQSSYTSDGLLVEMHPNPCEAWCDADQALNPQEFKDLMGSLRGIAEVIGRSL